MNFNKAVQRMLLLHKKGGVIPSMMAKLMYHYLRAIYSNDIPYNAGVEGVYFCHRGLGTVINAGARIGHGTIIQHRVTIGEMDGSHKCPIIGKDCFIGAGAMVLGDITVGNNVKVGAGALVIKDVPDNCTVVGVPAKVIKHN